MKLRNRLHTSQRAFNTALLAFAAWTGSAFAQSAPPSAGAAAAPEEPRSKLTEANTGTSAPTQPSEEVVVLSPFEVKQDTKGYYSSNTMSGTRFNTKLEDLGSSISVMTKEQMADFAMIDINDVFLYTAGAEGTGTYTDYEVDRNGQVTDNVQMNPTQANRLRGISSANISYNNYEVSGRMPIDPLLVEGIEISRGPNANVFGLGNAGGTVNQVATSANLFRDISRVEGRVDSYDGYRTALDLNRVLIKDKLAIRANGGFQHEGFVRKPSGVDTVRYNAFVKYKPFKNTTVSGSVLYYRMNGNRPNYTPPRDYVSDWITLGKATWDPLTQTVHHNGQSYRFTSDGATVSGRTLNSFGISRSGTMSTRANLFVDQNGIAYWTAPTTNSMTVTLPTPTTGGQSIRLMQSSEDLGSATASPGRYLNQPLFTTTPTVSNKDIYDWSEINVSSINRLMDRTVVYNAQLDQIVLETPRQMLAVQLGAFREDNERYQRTPLGSSGTSGQSGQLFVDVNERNLDGTPNPFFGKTYLASTEPLTKWLPSTWDTYRAQAAYRLDLRNENNLLKWLGVQQLSAYDEYKYRVSRAYSYREALTSNHSWTSLITSSMGRANQSGAAGGAVAAGPNVTRQYIRYYVGGNANGRIDYAPSDFNYGYYPFVWGGYSSIPSSGNPTGGTFVRDPAMLDLIATTDSTAGANNLKQIIKTPGVVLQSQFFDGKLVTVAGYRRDEVYSKAGANPTLVRNNTEHDFENDNHWAATDWRYNAGTTKTLSVVARPFRDIGSINQIADNNSGVKGFVADVARNISFTFNKSDNFFPQPPAVDLFLRPLPNITGEGTDYGFWLPLAEGKFVLRFNRWKTNQYNARNGDANTIAQRVLRKDILYSGGSVDRWNIPFLAANSWNAALGGLTGAALDAKIAELTGIPTAVSNVLIQNFQAGSLAATNDIAAKGTEIELNYNPSRYWTIAASATETESTSVNISSAIQDWIDLRMPVWTSLKDPVTGANWWTTNYGGSQTAATNHDIFVTAPYSVMKEQEGKSKPSVRKYTFKISSSFQLAALTDHKIFKNFKVGGSVRWEDKGAIGYYGENWEANLAAGTPITKLDPNNPIYDKAHAYFDAFVSYKTKLWSNKVAANIQLNVRNIQEDGRLQAIGAFPDGTPNAFRIVDPRQFILSVTFDL